jgi:hypothetical protein
MWWRAEWWTASGFKTSGTFYLPTREDVETAIKKSGGRVISIVEAK